MNQHANEFLELYNSGKTLQQIADQFKLSRTRVHFILSRHPDYQPMTRAERTARRNQAIRDAKRETNLTGDEIAKAFGVSRRTVTRVCRIVQPVPRE